MISKDRTRTQLAEVARFILAAIFLFSAIVKAIDPIGNALKIGDYLTSFGLRDFISFSMPLGITMIAAEFLLGALLLMGFLRKLSSWVALLMMIFMTLLTLFLLIENPIKDCGCFGDAIKLTNLETFLKNIVLLLLAMFYFVYYHRVAPAFNGKALSVGMFGFAFVALGYFIYSNIVHLPMLDFRPYKVGMKLSELVLVPPDALRDVYEYEFVYEKDGQRKSFDMNNLPDESWSYVDRKERLITVGYRPPVADFVLLRGTTDVTEALIGKAPQRMIWVVSPNWDDAHKGSSTAINQLYELAVRNGILFYGVSGSDHTTEQRWRNTTQAAYPTLLLDATTCKTMARGNPSIIFLKNGVLQAKLNALDLPSKDGFEIEVEKIFSSATPHKESYLLRSFPLGIWLIITLIAIVLPHSIREKLGCVKEMPGRGEANAGTTNSE